MSKKVKLTALLLVIVMILTACQSTQTSNPTQSSTSGPASTEPIANEPVQKDIVRYSVGTAAATGTHYAIGVAIADAINAHSSYLRLTPQVTGGGDENGYLVQENEMQFGFLNAEAAYNYKYGLAGQDLLPSLTAVCTLQANNHHLIARIDSGIETLADCAGKKIGMPAGSTSETFVKAALKHFGVEWETDLARGDITGNSDLVEKINDGDLDLIYCGGAAPMSTVIELMSSGKMKLISIDPEDLNEIFAEGYGGLTLETFSPACIPAGTYPNQDEDIWTSSIFNTLMAGDYVPEDDVYELCKVMYENWSTIRASHASIANKDVSELPKVRLDLHPGAEKFYREVGLID